MSELTRKHFKGIAAVLDETDATTWTIQRMAEYLATTNANFDYEKFVSACQVRRAMSERAS